jgi:hypothetical protein
LPRVVSKTGNRREEQFRRQPWQNTIIIESVLYGWHFCTNYEDPGWRPTTTDKLSDGRKFFSRESVVQHGYLNILMGRNCKELPIFCRGDKFIFAPAK